MNFFQYYFNNDDRIYEIDLSSLTSEQLTEINKIQLMTKTDSGRIRRARMNIKTNPKNVSIQYDKKGNRIVEYDFRANPSREFRNHWGYIIHDDNNIKQVFCCCKDFFYRIYAPMVRAGIATWDIPNKYKKRIQKFIKPHNHEWTKKTNPSGKIYVCKHLYALLQEYINKDIVKPTLKSKALNAIKRITNVFTKNTPSLGDKKVGNTHLGVNDALDAEKLDSDINSNKK